MKINRREFCTKSVKSALIFTISGAAVSFLESCGSSSNPVGNSPFTSLPSISTTVSNQKITLAVDSGSPLATVGGKAVILFNSGNNAVLVYRNSNTKFTAVSGICTHQGCIVTDFDSNNKDYVCPCHGSKFGLTGNVVQGPAQVALRSYTTNFSGNQLIIQV